MTQEPSDLFLELAQRHSTISAKCDCGITYFEDYESAGWSEGELESLRIQAQSMPDFFVASGSVHTVFIDGKEHVIGCPCGKLAWYENFIWTNRKVIAQYIGRKAEQVAESAYSDEAEAEFLKDSVARVEKNTKFIKCGNCGGYFPDNEINEQLMCFRCAKEIEDLGPLGGRADWNKNDKTNETPNPLYGEDGELFSF